MLQWAVSVVLAGIQDAGRVAAARDASAPGRKCIGGLKRLSARARQYFADIAATRMVACEHLSPVDREGS